MAIHRQRDRLRALVLFCLMLAGTLLPHLGIASFNATVTLTPALIRASSYEGRYPLTKWYFTLTNQTDKVLGLTLVSTVPWLSCVPAQINLTRSANVSLSFSPLSLKIGIHQGTIQIVSEDDFSVEELPVTLMVNPTPKTSDFATLSGIERLHKNGIFGQGTSVAVIDIGFKHLDTVLSSTRHPYQIATYDFTGTGLQTDSYHGMAAAEVVHGLAPEAMLYLLKATDRETLDEAVEFCIDSYIDIIVHPVGWFNFGYDGQGEIATIAEKARAHDILWVNSTGNHAMHHYGNIFTDQNQNNFHEFYANGVALEETNNFYLTAGEAVSIYLSWEDEQSRKQDYGLFLTHKNTVVASSATRQTNTMSATEAITSFFAPISGDYGIKIKRYCGSHDQAFSLFVDYPKAGLSYYTPEASLLSPADATGVLAVGAIGLGEWETDGPPAPYSSRGPTQDGRIKPDIMGPGTIPVTFGNFIGTSPACAYIGGVAALLKTFQPAWTATELESVLIGTSIDLGEIGKDVLYGSGKVDLSALTIQGKELYFPHVAMNSEWSTIVAITSLTDQPANLNIFTYDDTGQLLSFQPATLPPHAILSGTAIDISQVFLQTGSLKVTSDQQLAGMVLFRNKDDIAAASAISYLQDRLFFPCHTINDGRNWTGLALLNPHHQSTDITLSLFGNDGEQKAQQHFVLPPNEKLLGALANLFPSPLPAADVFTVNSTLPAAGLVVTGEIDASVASFSGVPLKKPPLLLPPLETEDLVPQIVMANTYFVYSFIREGTDNIAVIHQENNPMQIIENSLLRSAWQQFDFSDGKDTFLPGLTGGRKIVIPYLTYNNDLNTICVICNPADTAVKALYRLYSANGSLLSDNITITIPNKGCYALSYADIFTNGVDLPFEGSLFLNAAKPVYGASFYTMATKSLGSASLPAQLILEK
ncbi:MAG: hypothetical protein SRB2_00696 [Desulfobacteraceae bacterium Eth-SRB2]|nr:MAG: hypothetical protein SRB2_00696 [Desulfobacteraceae bacterium Eth-SRB2]